MSNDSNNNNPVPSKPAGLFEWWEALAKSDGLSLTHRGMLLQMAKYATTATGEDVRPSIQKMAPAIGVSRSTLTKNVGIVVQCGWLQLVEDRGRHGLPNIYRLSIPMTARTEAVNMHDDADPLNEGVPENRVTPHESHPSQSKGGARKMRQGVPENRVTPEAKMRQGVPENLRTTCSDTYSHTSSSTSSDESGRSSVWAQVEPALADDAPDSRATEVEHPEPTARELSRDAALSGAFLMWPTAAPTARHERVASEPKSSDDGQPEQGDDKQERIGFAKEHGMTAYVGRFGKAEEYVIQAVFAVPVQTVNPCANIVDKQTTWKPPSWRQKAMHERDMTEQGLTKIGTN